jgi:ankyrin repeat protein
MVIMFGSLTFYAFILVRIMALMAMGDSDVITKRNRYFDVQDFISAWNFSPELADDILKFFIYAISKDDLGGAEAESIFAQMPRLLQIDITRSSYASVVRSLELLSGLDEKFVDQLILSFKTVHFAPGITIINKGVVVNDLYLISGGIVEVSTEAQESVTEKQDEKKGEGNKSEEPTRKPFVDKKELPPPGLEHQANSNEEFTQLESGALVEMSFFFRIPAPSLIKASVAGEVSLFALRYEQYANAAAMYPYEADKIVARLAERLKEQMQAKLDAMGGVPGGQSARGGQKSSRSARGQKSSRSARGGKSQRTARSARSHGGSTARTAVGSVLEAAQKGGVKIPPEVLDSMETRMMDNVVKLLFAAHDKRLHSVKQAVIRGQDLNARDYDGRSVMHVAVCSGSLEIVEFCISNGADVNNEDRFGNTPFDDAIREGQLAIAEKLLEHGSRDLSRTDAQVLCRFAQRRDLASLKLYVKMGAIVDRATEEGRTPLHIAASEGFEEIVEFLLSVVFDAAPVDNAGRTPLYDALEARQERTIELLYANGHGAKLHVPDAARKMNTFASTGDVLSLRLFVKCGITCQSKDLFGRSPLHVAATAGRKASVEFLLENGADPRATDNFGHTPLDDALRMNHLVVAYLLLEAGAIVAGNTDPEVGWRRLRKKMEADMAEVQLLETSAKWEVERNNDQNVFLQNAVREVGYIASTIEDAVRKKMGK